MESDEIEKDFEKVENDSEKDSGMSSLVGSKDDTPERREIVKDNVDRLEAGGGGANTNEPDETIFERLWGLTEMFPEPVRDFCGTVSDLSVRGAKSFYSFSCNASWVFFTSSLILFAPIVFETERAQMEEMQKSQQKQVLLGPGSAALHSSGTPAMPAMQR